MRLCDLTRRARAGVVFRKSIRLVSLDSADTSVGKIVNLASGDADRVVHMMPEITKVWSGPLTVTAGVVYLVYVIGPAAFAGLGVMVALLPVYFIIAMRFTKLEVRRARLTRGCACISPCLTRPRCRGAARRSSTRA